MYEYWHTPATRTHAYTHQWSHQYCHDPQGIRSIGKAFICLSVWVSDTPCSSHTQAWHTVKMKYTQTNTLQLWLFCRFEAKNPSMELGKCQQQVLTSGDRRLRLADTRGRWRDAWVCGDVWLWLWPWPCWANTEPYVLMFGTQEYSSSSSYSS